MSLRQSRSEAKTKQGKRVTNSTLKKDFDFIRLVLKHAKEWEKSLDSLPQFPSFLGRTWMILPTARPFLPYSDWKKVRALAKERAAFETRLLLNGDTFYSRRHSSFTDAEADANAVRSTLLKTAGTRRRCD